MGIHHGYPPWKIEEKGMRILWMRKYVYFLRHLAYPEAELVSNWMGYLFVDEKEKLNNLEVQEGE